jgi:hypothetical protein
VSNETAEIDTTELTEILSISRAIEDILVLESSISTRDLIDRVVNECRKKNNDVLHESVARMIRKMRVDGKLSVIDGVVSLSVGVSEPLF